MKLFSFAIALPIILLAADGCDKKKKSSSLKARFEIKAICMNYTFTLVEGELDTSLVVASWTDENTNKTYKNAFSLVNPCSLPASLKEGDEFYFEIDSSEQKECIVCQAYYPTPPRRLAIRVRE